MKDTSLVQFVRDRDGQPRGLVVATVIDDKIRLPLEEELFLIKQYRSGKGVVLFDDLKIYRNQGRDAWRNDIRPRHQFTSDNFYEQILADTHTSYTDDHDTGYCAIHPKL